jgi:hypothetical protein
MLRQPASFSHLSTGGFIPVAPAISIAVVGLILTIAGWSMGIPQVYCLTVYRPATATIVSSVLKPSPGGRRQYAVIDYVFSVRGQLYQSRRLNVRYHNPPYGSAGQNLIDQFPANSQATAWYNPRNPSESFLIHQPEMWPFFLCLVAAAVIARGLREIVERLVTQRALGIPKSDGNGFFHLTEQESIATRFRFALAAAIGWYGYCALVVYGYYLANSRQMNVFSVLAAIAAAGWGFYIVSAAARYWRLQHDFSNADVRISSVEIHPLDEFDVRIHQRIRRRLEVEQLLVGVVEMRIDRTEYRRRDPNYDSSEIYKDWKTLEVNRIYEPGGHLDAKAHFKLPAGCAPSTPRNSGFPIFHWRVSIVIMAAGQPRFEANFPIRIFPRLPRHHEQLAEPLQYSPNPNAIDDFPFA